LGGVIDFRDAWVEELPESGEVETEYVRGEENLADLLTKCFQTYKFKRLMHQYDAAMEDDEYTRDNACHEVFVYYAFNAFPMIATIY